MQYKLSSSPSFDYYVFDLEERTVTSIYKAPSDDPSREWKGIGAVRIAAHREWLFLGYSSGHLVAVNGKSQTHVVLVKDVDSQSSIEHVSIQGGRCITGSRKGLGLPGVLTFWDLDSFKCIGQVGWPNSWIAPVWDGERLVMADNNVFATEGIEMHDYNDSAS
jgi:hypothetical protein